jgi:hypothetical protein
MRSRLTGAGGALLTLLAAVSLTAATPASVDRAGAVHRALEQPVVAEGMAVVLNAAAESLVLTRVDSLALRHQVAQAVALEVRNPVTRRDSLPRGRTPAETARRTPLNAPNSLWRSATSPSADSCPCAVDSCTSERAHRPSTTTRFRRIEQLRT